MAGAAIFHFGLSGLRLRELLLWCTPYGFARRTERPCCRWCCGDFRCGSV